MTFYKAHRNLLARHIPPEHCLTVDASQVAEYELGILSTGRRRASRRSVGFIDDRRRITVAVSRWQHKLIILLNREVGGHHGGGGHSADKISSRLPHFFQYSLFTHPTSLSGDET